MSGLEERANQYVEHSQPRFTNEMADNYFGVDAGLWNDWSLQVRLLFNLTLTAISELGIEVLDENTMPMPRKEFTTMAYNAALLAAESMSTIEKHGPGPKLCACI